MELTDEKIQELHDLCRWLNDFGEAVECCPECMARYQNKCKELAKKIVKKIKNLCK